MTRVFVVEDTVAVRRCLEDTLTTMGCVVESAGSIAEALNRLRAFGPDVVMIDMSLPDGNGLSLAVSIRQVVGGHAKVLLNSGEQDMAELARVMGSISFLPKPLSISSLAKALDLPVPGGVA